MIHSADIPFTKMSGAGNDFVVVDEGSGGRIPGLRESVARLCDRRRGIGADGLIVLSAASGADRAADFAMEYFNADGSGGSFCGNGGRCAAALMMERLGKERVTFFALGRTYGAEKTGSGVKLEMDRPGIPRLRISLLIEGVEYVGHFIDTGSPHLVIPLDSPLPDHGSVVEIGRKIRHHAEFSPGGTNVDFYRVMDKDRLELRTYERGVENETWACGTGAVAAGLIHGLLAGKEGEGSVAVVPKSGDLLTVGFHRSGSTFQRVRLEGPALTTFTGILRLQ